MKVAIGTWGSRIRSKMKCRLLLRLVILSGLWLLLPGCSEGDERRHPLFIQGEKAREDNDPATAVAHFKALWKRRPNAVYLHLELAGIYDEMLNDPLKALIHYELYLEQIPDSSEKATILKWQAQAEKQLYKSMQNKFAEHIPPAQSAESSPAEAAPAETPAAPAEPAAAAPETAESAAPPPAESAPDKVVPPAETAPEIAALKQQLAATQQQLEQYKVRIGLMRLEVARLRKAANIDPMRGRRPQPAAPASGVRTYTVQSGDTPGRIAQKFYGKSSLYPLIMRANPNISARSLRPGMVLKIPPLQP